MGGVGGGCNETHLGRGTKTIDYFRNNVSKRSDNQEDLEEWVPSSTVPTGGRKDASNVATQNHARALRVQLEALDDLRATRAQIVQRARRMADADNIQPRIMRQASGIERWTDVEPAMFETTLDEEMNKYEKFKDSIEEVTEKQDELLEQMKVGFSCLRSHGIIND